MFKNLLVLLLSIFLFFACSKKNNEKFVSEPTEEEVVTSIYAEAVEALKKEMLFMLQKNLKKLKVCYHKANGQARQVL